MKVTVLKEFCDLNDFTMQYKPGDSIYIEDKERVNKLVANGLVSKEIQGTKVNKRSSFNEPTDAE